MAAGSRLPVLPAHPGPAFFFSLPSALPWPVSLRPPSTRCCGVASPSVCQPLHRGYHPSPSIALSSNFHPQPSSMLSPSHPNADCNLCLWPLTLDYQSHSAPPFYAIAVLGFALSHSSSPLPPSCSVVCQLPRTVFHFQHYSFYHCAPSYYDRTCPTLEPHGAISIIQTPFLPVYVVYLTTSLFKNTPFPLLRFASLIFFFLVFHSLSFIFNFSEILFFYSERAICLSQRVSSSRQDLQLLLSNHMFAQ